MERVTTTERTPAQLLAALVGVTFLAVGILGFIPGITSHLYGGLHFAGHTGNAKLLHIFQVSWLHNLVHIAFGLAGLALARTWTTARTYLIGGGVIYLVLWLYGLIVDETSRANFVPFNKPDDWLHLGLGVGMIALGFATTRPGRAIEHPAV